MAELVKYETATDVHKRLAALSRAEREWTRLVAEYGTLYNVREEMDECMFLLGMDSSTAREGEARAV